MLKRSFTLAISQFLTSLFYFSSLPSKFFLPSYLISSSLPSSSDQAGMWRERARPVGQRPHVPVGARAEPPPARPVTRRDPKAEAAPSHPEEPRLCRQLPGQAGVPARSPGAAENGAPEGGGEARGRERRHEERAGGARRATGGAPEVRQGPGGRRGPPAGYSPTPEHRLSDHHREESTTAPTTERTGAVLEGAAGTRLGGGTHNLQCKHTHTHTHTYTIHTHAENRKTISVGKYLTLVEVMPFSHFQTLLDYICRSRSLLRDTVLTEWCVTSLNRQQLRLVFQSTGQEQLRHHVGRSDVSST